MKKLLFILFVPLFLLGCSAPSDAPSSDFADASPRQTAQPSASGATPAPSIKKQTPSPPAKKLYIDGARVRLYDAPGGKKLYELNMGQSVLVLGEQGEYTLALHDETQGYIQSELLSEAQHTFSEYDINLKNAKSPAIKVYKRRRVLEVLDGKKTIARFPIGLGKQPVGIKQKEGDKKTPEGKYYICTRNSKSKYYLSLGVSYPNTQDAQNALSRAAIDQQTYNSIKSATNAGKQPPWNTALGGEIMIHGKGASSDWTAGCIAVDNPVMDVLWSICKIGTPVSIFE